MFQDLQALEVLHSEGLKDCLKKWLLVMRLFVMMLIESEGLLGLFAGLLARLFAGPVCGTVCWTAGHVTS